MKLFEKARQIGFSGIGLSQKSGTPQPSTHHPPRYQTEKGVLDLLMIQ